MSDIDITNNIVLKVLPERVLKWLDEPHDAPFEKDEEYIEALSVQAYLHYEIRAARNRLVGVVYYDSDHQEQANHTLESLRMVAREVDGRIEARVARGGPSGWEPRLVRLSRMYEWTEREAAGFRHILIEAVSVGLKTCEDEVHHVMSASGMSKLEILSFIDPSRRHMREELFEIDDHVYCHIFKADVKLRDEVVKALVGASLSTEDLLRLEGTTLMDVLAAEQGFIPPEGLEGLFSGLTHQAEDFEDASGTGGAHPAAQELLVGAGSAAVGESHTGETTVGQQFEAQLGHSLGAYTTDLEYLSDAFAYVKARILRVTKEKDNNDFRLSNDRSKSSEIKELRGTERAKLAALQKRLEKTRRSGNWMPRLEELAENLGLDGSEKNILLTLVAVHISDEVKSTREVGAYGKPEVGHLLNLWADNLEEQIAGRKYFYKSGTLVKEGLIHVESFFLGELTRQDVEIDRRVLDYIVGLDSEAGDLVDGSHLYFPRVKLENVVLPPEQKKLALDTIGSFDALQRATADLGMNETMAYGRGLGVLFHGPSGTGKTMLAEGIANHLGKKVLLVNFPSLGSMSAGEVLSMLFRLARIHDALLFFDECDGIFESRENGNSGITTLLTEIERHDGPIIMATNRPQVLDPAMARRFKVGIKFREPDLHLRSDIWRVHLPGDKGLGEEIDIEHLAKRWELTGGLISNAVVTALALAVARDPDQPKIMQRDLERGAELQLQSHLRMSDLESSLVPKHGLDWLVAPDGVNSVIQEIVDFEKARGHLYGPWCFDRVDGRGNGVVALFHGEPGTGKTQAAESIAYEIGKPLRMVNNAELMSKWVGETAKNINALFADVENHDAVLLFEEADGLFGQRSSPTTSSDRFANVDTGVLLNTIERYNGLVILTTNLLDAIDPAFLQRIRYRVEFKAPNQPDRARLWRQLIPEEVPLAPDVDFEDLAARFALTGRAIKNAILRAAAKAVMRDASERMLTMSDLVEFASVEAASAGTCRVGFARQAVS